MPTVVQRPTFHTALAAMLTLVAAPANAQQSVAVRSYTEARAILDRGVEAIGGVEALRGLETIRVEFEGDGFARNQSARPEPPYDPTPRKGNFLLDRTRDAARFHLEFYPPRTSPFRNLILIRGDTAVAMDLTQRVAQAAPGNTM